VALRVRPSDDFQTEFKEYLESDPPAVLPVEFYETDWRDFADNQIVRRPRELATSYIDSRTIRSTSGVDYHTREMLSEHLDAKERAQISLAHRTSWQGITDGTLADINVRISAESTDIHHKPIGLQMDQSARTSWETGVVPQVADIPFAMAGQGQQASIKVALAMSRTNGAKTFVLIEEPENHLSHTNLTRLIGRIDALAGDEQQLFISTHSSFVLNRLGVDRLILLHGGRVSKLDALDASTVSYFRRLAGGYDTLRLVLAEKLALVEGPSDEIILQRAYRDATGVLPAAHGIDIVSMSGLTFARALELCAALDRKAVALQDNDGKLPSDVTEGIGDFLADGKRVMLVSNLLGGKTLEPQIVSVNDDDNLRRILGVTDRANPETWMTNNKTEAALRILDSSEAITMPSYISEAVTFLR
jgi:hypothetical protein